jgi:hypothetical protein
VVALVSDDQPVPGGQIGDVAAARQGLQRNHVDGAAQLRTAAAKLPGLDGEELGNPGPPLVGERTARRPRVIHLAVRVTAVAPANGGGSR